MKRLVLPAVLFAFALLASAQQEVEPSLAAYMEGIHAIDNHAHVVAPDMGHDKGYDALRCDELPPGKSLPPANLRFGPDVTAAWKALYGFEGTTGSDAELKKVQERQQELRKEHGANYFNWVLQTSGIDIALANRTYMAEQLTHPHFYWVPYDDALMYPLDNSQLKTANPERNALFTMNQEMFKTYLQQSKLAAPPKTLDAYIEQVVKVVLAEQKRNGAVAIKFEAAYLRSLDFQPPVKDAAAKVYAKYAASGQPTPADYKLLQDFLFKVIVSEAGKLGLAVHIHTGTGCGEYFNDEGSNPMLLSTVLNDPDLRNVNFVLLHGGTPFNRSIEVLILKPNVYVDTSFLEFFYSPQELARILRPWLEFMPERILFGTDAGPAGPGLGWEETTWLGAQKARKAVGLALTQMVEDGLISEERAQEIAKRIFRENARELYHLQ